MILFPTPLINTGASRLLGATNILCSPHTETHYNVINCLNNGFRHGPLPTHISQGFSTPQCQVWVPISVAKPWRFSAKQCKFYYTNLTKRDTSKLCYQTLFFKCFEIIMHSI